MTRAVSVLPADLQPGDIIRRSCWPPYPTATVVEVTENDDATTRIVWRDADGDLTELDFDGSCLLEAVSLVGFGEAAQLREERDEALARIDWLTGCPDGCDCEAERAIEDVLVVGGVL